MARRFVHALTHWLPGVGVAVVGCALTYGLVQQQHKANLGVAQLHFVDEVRALGVDIPIIPGIMPIVGFSKLARFSDACGAELPRWMRRKFEGMGDDVDSIRAFGLDIVTRLCERLISGGAPGLHFYSMNQSTLTLEICKRLGIQAC